MTADAEVWLGVAIAAAAGACIDGAVAFQAEEAQQVAGRHSLRPTLFLELFRRVRWLTATGVQVLGAGLQVLALTLAPLTLVQPTLAMGLIVLLLISSRRMGHPVAGATWAAVAAIIGGVTLLAVVAPEHTTTSPALWEIVLVTALLVAPMLAVRVAGADRAGALGLILGAGAGISLAAIGAKLVSDALVNGNLLHAVPYALMALAGVYGGQLIDMTALMRFGATRIGPPVFALEIAIPVALAPILFGEHWPRPLLVVAGLLIVLVAGWTISRAEAVTSMEDEGAAAASGKDGDGSPGASQDDVGR